MTSYQIFSHILYSLFGIFFSLNWHILVAKYNNVFTELRVNNEHLINRWIILLIARRLTFSPGSYGKDKEAM